MYTDDNSVYCENGVFTYNVINSKGDLVATAGSSDIDYKYNAYGEKLESSNDNNPIGYRNYYYDSETGLYYLKARYYDSTTGQFTQEDTVQDDNLQYNLYGYCSGNPVLYIDPIGESLLVIGAMVVISISILLTTTSCSSNSNSNNNYVIPPEYQCQPSGQNVFYKDGSTAQNCYGFALNKQIDDNPGYKSNNFLNKTDGVDKVFKYTKADLQKLKYKVKEVKKTYNPKKGETKICMRTSGTDYHFMRYKKGKGWLHKPGDSDILKLSNNKKPWEIGNWVSEATYDNGNTWIRGTNVYNSKIKYLVYYK